MVGNGFDEIRHVYPLFGREHVTDSAGDCWCLPHLDRLCTQCDATGCWACVDGWCRVESFSPGDVGVVIHHALYEGEAVECNCHLGR